jgi:serine protease Do
MSTNARSQQVVTLLLIAGAVVFGMVLAGGLNLTTPARTQPNPAPSANGEINVPAPSPAVPSFADLAQAVEPAVASIAATSFETVRRRRGIDPFEFFFGPRFRREEPEEEGEEEQERRSDSGGSGFVISKDGLIVTNHHVIDGADRVTVQLGERQYEAEVKGADPATDLALLQVSSSDKLDYLRLGDSDSLRVGDWVMAIGNPLGLDSTVTVGVVSAKGRSIGISQDVSFEDFIQTDAAINFGNSGGPLVNIRGEVVGIATAINYGAENIGFAVPVSTLKQILPQLRDSGRVVRGYLGVSIRNLDFEMKEAFGLDSTDGALITDVAAGTPAGEGGLRHGDIILQVDDHKVSRTRDLIDYISAHPPGTDVKVDLLRNGEQLQKTVELGERPDASAQLAEEEEEGRGAIDWLGIEYQDLTPGLRSSHGFPDDVDGVFINEVAPSSPLFEELVAPGDIIVEVNGEAVDGVETFEQRVGEAESGSFLRFYVRRSPRRQGPSGFFAIVRAP